MCPFQVAKHSAPFGTIEGFVGDCKKGSALQDVFNLIYGFFLVCQRRKFKQASNMRWVKETHTVEQVQIVFQHSISIWRLWHQVHNLVPFRISKQFFDIFIIGIKDKRVGRCFLLIMTFNVSGKPVLHRTLIRIKIPQFFNVFKPFLKERQALSRITKRDC